MRIRAFKTEDIKDQESYDFLKRQHAEAVSIEDGGEVVFTGLICNVEGLDVVFAYVKADKVKRKLKTFIRLLDILLDESLKLHKSLHAFCDNSVSGRFVRTFGFHKYGAKDGIDFYVVEA